LREDLGGAPRRLPTWLGWAGIVAGALFFSPGFFVALVAVRFGS
jgi:hypothetical protein